MTANDSLPEFRSSTSADGYLDIEVVCDEAGEAVIFVRGELDRDTVPLLTGCLQKILETRGKDRTVVVNLAGTTFIDVGGMCSLFDIAGMARDRGSRLYLAGCSAQLVRLLRLADLFDGLDVIPSGRM
jgi:anti-sigma B factor antagonist